MERGNACLRHLDRFAGIPLVFPAAIFRRLDRPRHRGEGRIGIICQGAIGDLLLLSGLAQGIRRQIPHAEIEIIASAANAAALPLVPHIDSFFAAPVSDIARVIARLRGRAYDILFDASQWARLGAILAAFSGAGLTVGFDTPGQHRARAFDLAVKHRKDRHEADNFLALGQAVWPGLSGCPGIVRQLAPHATKSNAVYCHMWPAPGKGRELKQWPQARWAALIQRLLAAGYEVALTGSAQDAPACRDFASRHCNGRALVLAGSVDLIKLAGLFENAAAVVSVNTGIMHLAALAGAPTIALHGATNPLRWGPIGENVVSVLPRSGSMAYLNLGFEYPPDVTNSMKNLAVIDVITAMRKLGIQL